MTSSLLVAMLAPLSASAAEGESLPEERTTVETEQITRLAYWNSKNSDTAPTAVTKQFPPEAACLVAPQLCNFPTGEDDPTAANDPTGGAVAGAITSDEEDEGEPGLGGFGNAFLDRINEEYGSSQESFRESEQGAPAEPVPSGSLPVSIAFGQPYYRSAIEFELPTVGADEQVDQFVVVFEEGEPTFANSSPALRQAVLATLTCARESDEEQGRCQRDEFAKIADRDLQDGDPLPYQLCPVGEDPITGEEANLDWKSGEAKDEATLPTANCLFGTQGTRLEIEGAAFWVFDLTLAMSEWAKGNLPYNGILFQPGAAENFAFGDAETTYSKQVTLLSENVSYAFTKSEAPPPPAPFVPPALPAGSDTGSTGSTGTSGGGDLFGTPPTPAANSPVSVPSSSQATTEQPAVAGGGVEAPVSSQPGDVVAQPAAAPGGSDWYVWLLTLPFLAGAYLMARSLEEEAVLAAGRSGGALTRLLERQAAERGPDLVRG